MVDFIDAIDGIEQKILDSAIQGASKDIEPGVAGECDMCGEHSPRLILRACAPCRMKYKLP